MRILIVGAGGVGGYFGGRLAAAGMDVVFLARGPTLETLRKAPLRIHSDEHQDIEVKAHAVPVEDVAAAGPFDLILWCVKSYQNEKAAEGLDTIATAESWWLPLQNGVETEDFLKARFPEAQILGGTCYVSALTDEPGKIRHFASGIVTFGDIGRSDPVRTPAALEKIGAALRQAGIKNWKSADVRADKWRKLIWNASLNTLSAVSGASPLELLAHDATRELVRRSMYEVVDVAKGLGIDLAYEHADKHIETTRALKDVRTSMAQDVSAGRPIEHEALCGVVVRLGEGKGVPTPVLKTFFTLLSLYEERRRRGG